MDGHTAAAFTWLQESGERPHSDRRSNTILRPSSSRLISS